MSNFLLPLSVLLILHECHRISGGDSSAFPAVPFRALESDFFNENSVNDTKLAAVDDSDRVLRRGKRYLDFVNGSRMSWRLMLKHNILKVNTLFAYGYGLRTNYPIPYREDRYVFPFNKREVFHMVEDVMDGHGFDGRACVLKAYCAALHYSGGYENGMLMKLMKLIFSLEHHEKRQLEYLKAENCKQLLYSHCPLDWDRLSPFTDIA